MIKWDNYFKQYGVKTATQSGLSQNGSVFYKELQINEYYIVPLSKVIKKNCYPLVPSGIVLCGYFYNESELKTKFGNAIAIYSTNSTYNLTVRYEVEGYI